MNNEQKIDKIMETLVGIQLNLKVIERILENDLGDNYNKQKVNKYFDQAIDEYINDNDWPTITK